MLSKTASVTKSAYTTKEHCCPDTSDPDGNAWGSNGTCTLIEGKRFLRARSDKTTLALLPVNRFQRSWTLFLAKIMPQIDWKHPNVMKMHPGALADL